MKSREMGSVTPEQDNANFKFKEELSKFGIADQKMIDKLLSCGKIIDVDVSGDSLEIFYKTGKYEKIVVKKSDVKKIDPKSGKVMETQKHFAVDFTPTGNYIGKTAGKKPSQEQYEKDTGQWG